ncbi:helix-turn-helix transcriptional regulator [Dinghuibacter silviterrae]|uniref:AraC-like DNA-binding protein n=1 Tax=Dinghuibacter silviterrae TaxID=1539049 RepID=A0A4R8DVB4_9BACT|nr:AraC family transcriptional regulator [Dinghuibacter silviterrae]TDX01858.1 AraC-like DNA-binding protein [Dinghuibacter silviterrae]
MFEITCNGVPQTWQKGVVLLPTIDEDVGYWPAHDLYNEYGCFSYVCFYAKDFTIVYHFYCTRQPVTLHIKRLKPLPEIFTSMVHPGILFRDQLIKQYFKDRALLNGHDPANQTPPNFYIGFRCQSEISITLDAGRQYAWCSMHVTLDALPWHSFPSSLTQSLYPQLSAWAKHGFQADSPQPDSVSLQSIRDMLLIQEDQQVWMSHQNALLHSLARQAILSIGHIKSGRPDSRHKREQDILEVAAILDANLADPPEVSKLVKKVGTNQTTLRQGFKEIFNTGIKGYITNGRIAMSIHLLLSTSLSEKEIAEETGYASPEALIKVFTKRFNKPPGHFRNVFRNVGLDRNASKRSL